MRLRVPGEKASDLMAWLAFLAAALGGIAASATWVGDWIAGIIGILPDWGCWVVFVGLSAMIVRDLLDNGVPNKLATVYFTIIWPSSTMPLDGRIGDWLAGRIDWVNRWIETTMAEWLTDSRVGQASILTMATFTFIALALFWTHSGKGSGKRGAPEFARR